MDVFSHFLIYSTKLLFIAIIINWTWTPSSAQPSPNFVLPVMHRASSLPSLVRQRRSTATRNMSEVVVNGRDSAAMAAFSSKLITLNEPFGQYFAVMNLGSPPAGVALIIDTGSEIVWVQCEPCRKCGLQVRDPIFDPSKSSSYRQLNCTSELCKDITGLDMGCTGGLDYKEGQTMPKMCFYNATYGDNSASYGKLSVDTLTIPALDGKTLAVPEFVFGCGIENTGVETEFNSSGIMGLDRGRHSAVSQLGEKFAYCLPDRSHNIDATGFISFSRDDTETERIVPSEMTESLPMKYANLLVNNKTQFYAQSYYVNLTGIRVGRVLVDMAAHDVDPVTGNGGTIIDTGTSLTVLVDGAYVGFRDALRRQVGGSARLIEIPELPGFDTCYSVAKRDGAPLAPDVALRFDGAGAEVEVVLPKQNVWLQVGREGSRNIYCLAFTSTFGTGGGNVGDSGGGGGRNVIGNFQQQDFVVEYDLWRGRIGFGHLAQCGGSVAFGHNWSHFLLFVNILLVLFSS